MARYRIKDETDGNLGIYCEPDDSRREMWIGTILDPVSPNPALALGVPLGILGVRKILDLFKRWQVEHRPTGAKRKPSPRSAKCRRPTRKWRKAYHARE
jgi:hypothetical protein